MLFLRSTFFAGGSLEPNSPIYITPPSAAILQSLCKNSDTSASPSQVPVFGELTLPACKPGVLTVDFLGSEMPSCADLLAAQPRMIGGKRRKIGGANNKQKRAKVDKMPESPEAADAAASFANSGLLLAEQKQPHP